MNDEAAFQRQLDENHDDFATRGVFGDWLADRGDERAAGYWWMARERKIPERFPDKSRFDWNHPDSSWAKDEGIPHTILPLDLFILLPRTIGYFFRSYKSRREAEEALCRVIYQMETATV